MKRWLVFLLLVPSIAWAQLYPSASTDVGITSSACPNWAATKTNTSGRTVSSSGTISYEEITGQLTIASSGVTLSCVKINANDNLYGISCGSGACNGTVVQDSEIYNCDSACILAKSPSEAGRATYSRLYIHDSQNDLVKISDYSTLQDSFLEDDYDPAPDAHNDAIQLVDGLYVTIERNNIQGPFQAQTSAIIAKTDSGPIDRLTVSNNRLSGGTYTLYLRDGGSGNPSNTTVTGNTWVDNSWQFGALSSDVIKADCVRWAGNWTTADVAVTPGSSVISCSCP